MLQRVLEDSLDEDLLEALIAHVNECDQCRAVLKSQLNPLVDFTAGVTVALTADATDSRRLDKVIESLKSDRTGQPPSHPSAGIRYRDVLPWISSNDPDSRDLGSIGRVGDYRLLEFVGRGGMGVVFQAVEESLDRVVAVKLMSPSLLADDTAKHRFEREAKAAAAVNHINIVAVYAVAEHDGLPYLVTEFVAGETLSDRIQSQGALPIEEVLQVGCQIVSGLKAAHEKNIVHRDIKPSNILIEVDSGTAKITDFGLARCQQDGALTLTASVVGTPAYIAPEILMNPRTEADQRADLFSVGCILYLMCAGVEPFAGHSVLETLQRVTAADPVPLKDLRPETPQWLAEIVHQLMAKNPDDRPHSAAQVEGLILQGKATGAPQGKALTLASKKCALWLWVPAAMACSLGLLAYFGGNWSGEPSGDWLAVRSAEELRAALTSDDPSRRIRIDSDGPFELHPLQVETQDLEIIAGSGFRPVIRFQPASGHEEAMLSLRGDVRLSGVALELVRDTEGAEGDNRLILSSTGFLFAECCRFVVEPYGTCIVVEGTAVELIDCEIYSSEGVGVICHAEEGTRLTLQNCIIAGGTGIELHPTAEVRMRVQESRFVTEVGIQVFSPEENQSVEIDATDSLFDTWTLLSFAELQSRSLDEVMANVRWRGRNNTFWGEFTAAGFNDDFEEPLVFAESLAQWCELDLVDEEEMAFRLPRFRLTRPGLEFKIDRASQLRERDFNLRD